MRQPRLGGAACTGSRVPPPFASEQKPGEHAFTRRHPHALVARLDFRRPGSHRPPEMNPYWLAQNSFKARLASRTACG